MKKYFLSLVSLFFAPSPISTSLKGVKVLRSKKSSPTTPTPLDGTLANLHLIKLNFWIRSRRKPLLCLVAERSVMRL